MIEQAFTGNTLVNSFDNVNLIASNFITQNGGQIIANKNLNILDGKNTQSSSSYDKNLNIDSGITVGNAYVDAAYSVVDAVKAQKDVKDAYDKLNKIEKLHDQDQASSKAVERAKTQLYLSLVNAGLTTVQAMQAVQGAAASSETFGFYGSGYVNITNSKATQTSEFSQSQASNLISKGNLSLTANQGDINITGSNVGSTNGNLDIAAIMGNLNVKAAESTISQSSKFNSQNAGGSIGTKGYSANIGFNQSESSLDATSFTNSTISAQNGKLSIKTGGDLTVQQLSQGDKGNANLSGANLIASDLSMKIAGNLTLKSKQNLLESDFHNIGASLGISGSVGEMGGNAGSGSSINGGNGSFSIGSSFQSRAWVDQASSIIGTKSISISVGTKDEQGNYINNTGNTNIIGAVIANSTNGKLGSEAIDGGNLTLNTNTLNYSDLKNHNNSDSNQFSASLQIGNNPNNPTIPGNLTLTLSQQGREQSSNSKATVGNGNIIIGNNTATADQTSGLNRDITNIETNKRDILTSDFDSKITIDVAGAKIAYKLTPFGVNKDIEATRGSEQSLMPGGPAVYKSGDEPNGVRDENANNVGMAVIPRNLDGSVNLEKVGKPILFSDLVQQGVGAAVASESGIISRTCNYGVIGCNDMSKTHDNWVQNSPWIKETKGMTQLTIIPAYIYNTYGLIGMPVNRVIDYINEPKNISNPTPIKLPEPVLLNASNQSNSTNLGLTIPQIKFPSANSFTPEFNQIIQKR